MYEQSIIITAGYGSWSPDNCIVKENNETFVVCECTHFADFAVVSEHHKQQY